MSAFKLCPSIELGGGAPDRDQKRFEKAIDQLEIDPRKPRPGPDIVKLKDTEGGGIYRLRVGVRRACYAVITADREVHVVGFDDREAGYTRMLATAQARLKRRLRA